MPCLRCSSRPVIKLQHGSLCRTHFLSYFERKVDHTISKYGFFKRTDTLCVAASGGKDSLTVLYLTKKYLERHRLPCRIFVLAIDEGIRNYRKNTLRDLKKFCRSHNLPLTIISASDEFEYTLDKAIPEIRIATGKKPCHLCGVWRRYLINKHARRLGAAVVVTGHNLDDEAQAILMNTFKANTTLSSHLGPRSGIAEHRLFAQRVKPLYFCPEKEVRLYALLKGFRIGYAQCPYANAGLRSYVQNLLNETESIYPGTKQSIINSFLNILPLLRNSQGSLSGKLQSCTICQEPSNGTTCNVCRFQQSLPVVPKKPKLSKKTTSSVTKTAARAPKSRIS